jgi:hypothetical protein
MVRAWIALGAGLGWAAAGSLIAISPQTTAPPSKPAVAEFPPSDMRLYQLVQAGITAKLATRSLVEAPDSPETFRLLAQASRPDDALRTLQLIVDRHPERLAAALKDVSLSTLQLNDTRGYWQRFQDVVVSAHGRLAGLPREEAAGAERVLMNLDTAFTRDRNSWPEKLKQFTQQFAGTEAALLTEVDLLQLGRVSQQQIDELGAFADAHPGTVPGAKALFQKGFQLHVNVTVGYSGATVVLEKEAGKWVAKSLTNRWIT